MLREKYYSVARMEFDKVIRIHSIIFLLIREYSKILQTHQLWIAIVIHWVLHAASFCWKHCQTSSSPWVPQNCRLLQRSFWIIMIITQTIYNRNPLKGLIVLRYWMKCIVILISVNIRVYSKWFIQAINLSLEIYRMDHNFASSKFKLLTKYLKNDEVDWRFTNSRQTSISRRFTL